MRAIVLSFLLLASARPALTQEARENIVFILGQEEGRGYRMYELAEAAFREQAHRQVVSTVHSLTEVRDYLEAHAPRQPWGRVELVLHGNGQGQTDVPLSPGSEPLTAERLEEACAEGTFPPLPDSVLDGLSEIRMHGCALGQDEALLRLVSRAFGGPDAVRPRVRASRLFTCFQPAEEGVQTFMSEAWSLVSPASAQPSLEALSEQLHARSGCSEVLEALDRRVARFPGDWFSYRSPAEFQWTLVLADVAEAPRVLQGPSLVAWLLRQPLFKQALRRSGYGLEMFDWKAEVLHLEAAGRSRMAVRVNGKGEGVYLMHAMPSEVAWEDARYCVSVP